MNPVETLWETYCCRLYAFIRSRVASQADAEDLLQEVFLRVHRQLCCSPDWEKPEAWFYLIARNQVIDYYRRRRDLAEISDDLPAPQDETETVGQDPEVELALSLKEMVQSLPEPHRQSLLWAEFEGQDLKSMAERWGISLSGAKSRVQRARQKLKDVLLACCHFELDRRGRVLDYYPHCESCSASSKKG